MPRREPTVVEQECVQCNAVKPAKDFDKNGSGLNGLRRACKACMKVRANSVMRPPGLRRMLPCCFKTCEQTQTQGLRQLRWHKTGVKSVRSMFGGSPNHASRD